MARKTFSIAVFPELIDKVDILVLAQKKSRNAIIEAAIKRVVEDSLPAAKQKIKVMLEEKKAL